MKIPPAPVFLSKNSPNTAPGNLAKIPTVINNEIPFPIPLSVIANIACFLI